MTYAWCLEVATMPRDAVYLHLLFLEQDIVTDLQHADGTVEVGTHEVGQVELVAGRAHEHGASLLQARNRLTADIVVGHQTTAVGITLEGLIEELAIKFVHVDLDAQQLLVFLEEPHPGIDVAGAVIAVDHSHQ